MRDLQNKWIVDPDFFRQRRMHAGLSQSALALLTGLGVSTIGAIESGSKGTTSSATVRALSSALRCNPKDIASEYYYPQMPERSAEISARRQYKIIDTKLFKVRERYVINGDFLRFVGTTSGYGGVSHFLFRQPTGGWIISYTNIDFMVGDISVETVDRNSTSESRRKGGTELSLCGSNGGGRSDVSNVNARCRVS